MCAHHQVESVVPKGKVLMLFPATKKLLWSFHLRSTKTSCKYEKQISKHVEWIHHGMLLFSNETSNRFQWNLATRGMVKISRNAPSTSGESLENPIFLPRLCVTETWILSPTLKAPLPAFEVAVLLHQKHQVIPGNTFFFNWITKLWQKMYFCDQTV